MNDLKLVMVTLRGCDDSTEIALTISPEESAFLKKLELLSKAASTCTCMPTLSVKDIEEPK